MKNDSRLQSGISVAIFICSWQCLTMVMENWSVAVKDSWQLTNTIGNDSDGWMRQWQLWQCQFHWQSQFCNKNHNNNNDVHFINTSSLRTNWIELTAVFFDADTQLYTRLCPSVRPSVVIESKSGKTSVSSPFCECMYVGLEYWGVDGGWTPLPTRSQWYCDPASLVLFIVPLQLTTIFGQRPQRADVL